jgi:hypothetical protein
MQTPTLLPLVRVAIYDGNKRVDRQFSIDLRQSPSVLVPLLRAARYFRKRYKRRLRDCNVYFIEKVNGTWSTDWTLAPNGKVMDHPWRAEIEAAK